MIARIHRHTSNRRTDIQPSAPSSFAQHTELPVRVGSHTDSRARIAVDTSHLAGLQLDLYPACIFGCCFISLLSSSGGSIVLRDDDSVCTCRAAEHTRAMRLRPDVIDLRSRRDKMQRQTVSAKRCLRSQHTRINDASHLIDKSLRYSSPITRDPISLPHPISSNNVRELRRDIFGLPPLPDFEDIRRSVFLAGFEESEVSGAVGIVFYAHDFVFAGAHAVEIYGADATAVSTSPVSYTHLSSTISSTLSMPDLGKCELADWLALVQVLVYRAAKPSQSGRARGVLP
jgi:hypothetical protein